MFRRLLIAAACLAAVPAHGQDADLLKAQDQVKYTMLKMDDPATARNRMVDIINYDFEQCNWWVAHNQSIQDYRFCSTSYSIRWKNLWTLR